MVELEKEHVKLEGLLLDPNNYRFQDLPGWKRVSDSRYHESRVQQDAQRRLRDTAEFELELLKDSIRTNGFVPLEQIVVRPYAHDEGKYVVVEGNRRVAAIKWLLEDQDSGVLTLDDAELAALKELDVLKLQGSDEDVAHTSEVLMAIRHVSGVKEWGAYQQARLIAELMSKDGASFSSVAAKLGMSAREVARRFRASKALQQMQEHEEYREYAEPSMYGMFHEVFASTPVRDWLEWDEERKVFTSRANLEAFYGWISDTPDQPAKITSVLDIRQKLRPIIQQPRALDALKDPGTSLDEAHEIAIVDAGTSRSASSLEAAVRAAMRVLHDLPTARLRTLSPEHVDLLRQLSEMLDQAIEDRRRLVGD